MDWNIIYSNLSPRLKPCVILMKNVKPVCFTLQFTYLIAIGTDCNRPPAAIINLYNSEWLQCLSENWLLEMGVKLMYYEQLRCIMHWFRLNQGLSKALDSFEAVQGSMRLSEHFVLKKFFFSPTPPYYSSFHQAWRQGGLKRQAKVLFLKLLAGGRACC